ncbi:interleukin-4 receptor subunit alpha isoform X3 [Theropithecus gelada]|uniref:Interleukin-4 receptor subunit alpha n=1 Tax=Theropithecus gelada TaxID=9565 RepID=A0A8D2FKP4_THEGE|nr:interleukin-4 receptor subunit alpha isoform X3 [Theropithecus gelada]XP_025226735.1 interleukin-4 receptor subunit alpha isoform X3 [Theropithecus gelada]
MGWLCSGLLFPVSCVVLLQVASSGSMKVLQEPTCVSDYMSISICEWKMGGPTNCSAELRLLYQLVFQSSETYTCVPENNGGVGCVCHLLMEDVVSMDNYTLDLWAGQQLLWKGSFKPSEHVKPRAPGNLTVYTNVSDTVLLTWSNPYPPDNYLYNDLTYAVNIWSENDPADSRIYNVTYLKPTLRIPASTLKSGISYRARVRAWAQHYNTTWSEWSPSTKWYNSYREPFEQRLLQDVGILCSVILVICVLCYVGITKIKKAWWDQIPNPARSHLVAIIIQDAQESPWEKRSRGQEAAKCPYWKNCLTKLLPCFLEHNMKRDEDPHKAVKDLPFRGSGKSAWCPVEISKTVLWPESISVVRCVELFEAPVECKEEEEVEEEKESFCASSESNRDDFQEGREGIVARLTESLFLDLLGGENGGFCQQDMGESCLLPPLGSTSAHVPWDEFPSAGPKEVPPWGKEQPLHQEPSPPASPTQSPDNPTCTEMPLVISSNPAYRSFSNSLSQSPCPRELGPDPLLARHLEEVDPEMPCAPQLSEPTTVAPAEPETWEQILRRNVLQHGAAAAPASAPTSGYREFVHAVQQGGIQASAVAGLGPPGEAGYKAFSSLLASSAVSPGECGFGASSGEEGYKPFQDLTPGCPGDPAPVPVPLFTFGLDREPPHSPQSSHLPSSSPEHLGLEPGEKVEDMQKPPLPPEQATDPLGDSLGSGIVYSALTCHLCGHLKQCHGQEDGGQAPVVASPCCGCCCGDRSSPPTTPLRAPDPCLGGVPLEASLCPASLAPSGISEKSKSSLCFHPAPGSAQSSSQTPQMVNFVSVGPTCMRVS